MDVAQGAGIPAHEPPPPDTKGRRTHDALLDALERCLAAGGYPAATSTAVAAEAGVSTGTFYTYFDDRHTALAAAFARRLRQLVAAVEAELAIESLLDDGLRAVLERAVDAVLDEYRQHAATYRAALAQLPSSAALRETYWRAHEVSERTLTTFLRRAQSAGRVREQADPRILALTLLVVVQAANNPLLLADPDAEQTRAIRGELIALLDHLLTGEPTAGRLRSTDRGQEPR